MSEGFEIVEKPEITKIKWAEVIKAADENVGKAIVVKKKPASVVVGIRGYLKKQNLLDNYVVVSKDGKVYVFKKE